MSPSAAPTECSGQATALHSPLKKGDAEVSEPADGPNRGRHGPKYGQMAQNLKILDNKYICHGKFK